MGKPARKRALSGIVFGGGLALFAGQFLLRLFLGVVMVSERETHRVYKALASSLGVFLTFGRPLVSATAAMSSIAAPTIGGRRSAAKMRGELIMFPGPHAARLQITAGATLLHQSKRVEWSPSDRRFLPVSDDAFEYSARNDIDPAFGRLICWLTLSSGVEFLGKGLCIEHGIDFWNGLTPASTCDIPTYPISVWLDVAGQGGSERREVRLPTCRDDTALQ